MQNEIGMAKGSFKIILELDAKFLSTTY